MPINDYATLTELKAALPDAIPSTDSSYDTLLTDLLTRASRRFDVETKRRPGAYAMATASSDEETRFYNGTGGNQLWVNEMVTAPSAVAISETGSVTSSDYSTVASSDYFLWPDNAAFEDSPYLRIDLDTLNGAFTYWPRHRKAVKVTAVWGYCDTADTPPDVKQAVLTQALRWYGRARQGYQGAGANANVGQLIYTDKPDEDFMRVVMDYRRATV